MNPEVSFSFYKANRLFDIYSIHWKSIYFFFLVLLSEEVERGGVGL